MEYAPEILKALASLLWPLIVIVLLFSFRGQMAGLIETARMRKFTVKVGEMELSMDEYNKQQGELIKDLQNQVAALQKQYGQPAQSYPAVSPRNGTRSILWVDDHPRNNAVMIQNLSEAGITVTNALNTQEALGRLRTQTFDKVVTDMTHPDSGNDKAANAAGGIELVKSVRVMNENLPIYIYTTAEKAEKMFDEAQEVGANQITGSATILMALLKD